MGADRYHLQRRTAIFTQDILVTKAKRERSTIHHKIESTHEITIRQWLWKKPYCPDTNTRETYSQSGFWLGLDIGKFAFMVSDKTLYCYVRAQQTFSTKDQIVNNLVFVGHVASLASAQLCHYNVKADMNNM